MEEIGFELLSDDFEPREYQINIAKKAKDRNTLCILPTGLGKTYCAIMVVAFRLKKYENSKALILAPSRPLVHQHLKTFSKYLKIEKEKMVALTGKIPPKNRGKLYEEARIIFSTPQLIKNDLLNKRFSLADFSCLVVDECHRSVKKYPYPFIAKMYVEQSKFPLILGLTASPGGRYEKIEEIKKNLFIDIVEIRTESDKDVIPYVQKVSKEWVYVELPEEFKKIRDLLDQFLKERVEWLREYNFFKSSKISRKLLLELQDKISEKFVEGSTLPILYPAMRKVSEAIKIVHAIELLETQGVLPLKIYLEKLKESGRRTDLGLFKDPRIREAFWLANKLYLEKKEHPKLDKLINLVKDILRENENFKIIVFANYRSTVERIKEILENEGIRSEILIGQASRRKKGLTQKKQIETLERFRRNEFNVLVGTSITEEGLSVPDVNCVIFFDAVPSEIRSIQRRGRTGRTSPGRIIFMITKGTADEAFYWSSFHKERKMKGILYDMRDKEKKGIKSLKEWLK